MFQANATLGSIEENGIGQSRKGKVNIIIMKFDTSYIRKKFIRRGTAVLHVNARKNQMFHYLDS